MFHLVCICMRIRHTATIKLPRLMKVVVGDSTGRYLVLGAVRWRKMRWLEIWLPNTLFNSPKNRALA